MSEMDDISATTPKNTLMSDEERTWLAEHWHHLNDIGDAEEREEWRDAMRLRRLGIDPNSSQMEILQQLRKLERERDLLREAHLKGT